MPCHAMLDAASLYTNGQFCPQSFDVYSTFDGFLPFSVRIPSLSLLFVEKAEYHDGSGSVVYRVRCTEPWLGSVGPVDHR